MLRPWQRAAPIRTLGAMRIPPGLISGVVAHSPAAPGRPGLRAADPLHAAAADDVDRADLTFTARDGLTLYARRWRCAPASRARQS